MESTYKRFKKYKSEYLNFEEIPIEKRLHKRPDLCGLLYLSNLQLSKNNLIDWAGKDEIQVNFNDFDSLTDENILYLVRCGILYKDGTLYKNV